MNFDIIFDLIFDLAKNQYAFLGKARALILKQKTREIENSYRT